MEKVKKLISKYLTPKVRTIIALVIIVLGSIFLINYSFFEPTYINKYISMNIYKEPANSYFDDQNFYNCVIASYNSENNTSLPYTANLTDEQLGKVKSLTCYSKGITSAKGLEKLTELTYLDLSENQLAGLNLAKNTKLDSLLIFANQLTSLDVSKNTALEYLNAYYNKLTSLDVSKNAALKGLAAYNNQLTSLDLSKNTALEYLWAYDNQLTSLDVSQNAELGTLEVYNNQLTNLDVSKNTALKTLHAYNNQLTSIRVGNNTILNELSIDNNQITSLDVSKNTSLIDLDASNNLLTNLDVSNNTALISLHVDSNQLTSLDVSQNAELGTLEVYNNQLTSLDVSKNTNLTTLRVENYNNYSNWNQLTSLDVSTNTALTDLRVGGNQLTSLDVSTNTALTDLRVGGNQLTSLDVSKNTALKYLDAYSNQLTSLDLSKNTKLETLDVFGNELTSLAVGNNIKLKKLYVHGNKLTSINVSKNIALTDLDVSDNKLTHLNISNNTALNNLYLHRNNFGDTINCYVGDSKNIINPVILPSHLDNSITWKSNDESIATVDNNGKVVAKKIGTTTVKGTSEYYTVTINVNAYEMTSDKYSIYNSDDVGYVYTKEDVDSEIIKSHLTLPEGISINITNNKIDILENNSVIKTFNIISFKSIDNHVIVKNNYILTQMIDVNDAINMINLTNGTSKISNNQLIIKYNGVTVDTIPIIYMNTNYKYDISEKYIYTRNDIGDVVKNNIDTNGDILIQDNHIKILYNDEEIISYLIKSFNTNYKVGNGYIYTGINVFNKDNVELNGVESLYKNNVLKIKYNDIELDSFNILTISFNDLQLKGKYIIIDPTSEISKELFLSKISKNNDNITFKILNKDDIEIGSTDSLIGNYLKVYYNNKEIDSYNISDVVQDYIEFDEKLKVEENKKIIYDVKVNTKLKNITSLIDTNGIIKIYDKNDTEVTDMESKVKTGYKIKIELSDKVEEYKLSVRGDTKGTGEVNILSAMKIINHILKTEEFVGDEYYMAADLTGDNQILINDAMRIIKYILYREEL